MRTIKTSASILLPIIAFLFVACAPTPPFEATLPPLPAGVTDSFVGDWDTLTPAGAYLLSNCPWNQKSADPPYAHRIFEGVEGHHFNQVESV